MARRKNNGPAPSRSWDAVARWYTGWVGATGSEHHRRLAIPTVLELLELEGGERVLDLGCGPGVLAPSVAAAGATYTGVDSSRKLLAFARRHHARHGRFLHGDATRLDEVDGLRAGAFDAAVFLLSIQDIDPLEAAIRGAAWAIRPGGRLVLLMTHPCFRIPRQSGWGWDPNRRLQFRRVDRYLTPLVVPMKPYEDGSLGSTRSHHRPLHAYVDALAAAGLRIEAIREVPAHQDPVEGRRGKAVRNASREIPLFLGVRAGKG